MSATTPRMLGMDAAIQVCFDLLFEFLEECDQIRSTQDSPTRLALWIDDLIDDLGFGSGILDNTGGIAKDIERAFAAKGWLDDSNPERIWSSPCDLHAGCWAAIITGSVLAFKDAMRELRRCHYHKNDDKKPKYGPVCTRNENWNSPWKKKHENNPKKPKGPRGRPVEKQPLSRRQLGLLFPAIARADNAKRQRRYRRKHKGQKVNPKWNGNPNIG